MRRLDVQRLSYTSPREVNAARDGFAAQVCATKLAYGLGQLGEGFKNSSFETFLFFYYNQVLGLSGTLAGLATAIALVFDAVIDPVSVRSGRRLGRARRGGGCWRAEDSRRM